MSLFVLYFVLIGFLASGVTHTARAVVPQEWLFVKPLSCDLCMSWWGSWLGMVLMSLYQPVEFFAALCIVLAATGLSVLLVKASNRLGL